MTEPVGDEIFDPYHKWLGISPKDQPPHHYRLLAIDLFESDPDVIAAAADKQMAFIRSFQSGKNSQLSQKILNEISAARLCLLNVVKKAEYDQALRAWMATSGIRKGNVAIPNSTAPAEEEVVELVELVDGGNHVPPPLLLSGNDRSQIRRKKSKKATVLPLAVLGAMLVVCLVAIALVMSRTPETQVSKATQDAEGSVSPDAPPSHVAAPAHDSQSPLPANPIKPAPPKVLLPSLPSKDSAGGPVPIEPPETGKAGETPGKGNQGATGETRLSAKAVVNDDPFLEKPAAPSKPGPAAKSAEAEKDKTPEDFEKQLANAKTPEDFKEVTDEALHAADKAMDGHHQDMARQFLLKALVAARKSGDSKLIFKATRAFTKPESIKEILAE